MGRKKKYLKRFFFKCRLFCVILLSLYFLLIRDENYKDKIKFVHWNLKSDLKNNL